MLKYTLMNLFSFLYLLETDCTVAKLDVSIKENSEVYLNRIEVTSENQLQASPRPPAIGILYSVLA